MCPSELMTVRHDVAQSYTVQSKLHGSVQDAPKCMSAREIDLMPSASNTKFFKRLYSVFIVTDHFKLAFMYFTLKVYPCNIPKENNILISRLFLKIRSRMSIKDHTSPLSLSRQQGVNTPRFLEKHMDPTTQHMICPLLQTCHHISMIFSYVKMASY